MNLSKPLPFFKSLIALLLAWASFVPAKSQQALFPDSIVSINADSYIFTFSWHEHNPLYEFSDGSIVIGVIGFDTTLVATSPNGTNYSQFMEYRDVTLITLDSNFQFKNSIAVTDDNFVQVGDTLFGTTTAWSGELRDLNPAGSPVIVSGSSNCSRSYLVAYDKDLQLIRHQEINCKGLAYANIRDIRGGKIFVSLNEKDYHPQGGQFGMGRQRLATFDHQFNQLSTVTVFNRQGTYWGYNILDKLIPAVNGGYYGAFAGGTVGLDYNIALNGQTPVYRPASAGYIAYLAKYDANLNLEWDTRVEFGTGQVNSVRFQDLLESPSGDSLVMIMNGDVDEMFYHQGGNSVAVQRDTNVSGNDFILFIDPANGILSSSYSTDMNNPIQPIPGGKVYREAKSHLSSSTGIVGTEYLNFKNNTLPVPDSSSAIAIYDDIGSGVPSSYRILGYMGPNSESGIRFIAPAPHTNRLLVAGFYRGNLSLDSAYPYTLPDYNNETSVFLGAFGTGPLLGNETPIQSDFSLFPNPATSRLVLNHTGEQPIEILLINLKGEVLTRQTPGEFGKTEFFLDGLSAGIYFVESRYKHGERYGKKFVKQ